MDKLSVVFEWLGLWFVCGLWGAFIWCTIAKLQSYRSKRGEIIIVGVLAFFCGILSLVIGIFCITGHAFAEWFKWVFGEKKDIELEDKNQ